MKLSTYMAKLNELVRKNPKALQMDVVTSSDDESNSFNDVLLDPSIGVLYAGEFRTLESLKEYYGEDVEPDRHVVCLN